MNKYNNNTYNILIKRNFETTVFEKYLKSIIIIIKSLSAFNNKILQYYSYFIAMIFNMIHYNINNRRIVMFSSQSKTISR